MRLAAWGLVKRSARRGSLNLIVSPKKALHVHAPIRASHQTFDISDEHPRQTSAILAQLNTTDQSDADVQLLNFINSGLPSSKFQLPAGITRIDAYLHLRSTAPASFAHLSDEALSRLCMQAGTERLGGVVGALLDDLEGKNLDDESIGIDFDSIDDLSRQLRDSSTLKKGGVLLAQPGSKRRLAAIKNLLMGASRKRTSSSAQDEADEQLEEGTGRIERLLSASILQRAFAMLFHDFNLLKSEQNNFNSSSPIPDELDERVARRLIRTISLSFDAKLAPILSELIRHVKRFESEEWRFPVPAEGCRLLDYYLSLDEEIIVDILGTPAADAEELPKSIQAARNILDQMNIAEPWIVSEVLIDDASKKGQDYSNLLIEQGVSPIEASQIGLRFTLRCIMVSVQLKLTHYNRLDDQLQQLVDEMKAKTMELNIGAPLELLADVVRTTIYLVLSSEIEYPKAFDLAKRFVNIWSQDASASTNGDLLRKLCERAIEENQTELAMRILELVLDQKERQMNQVAPEASIIGGDTLLEMIKYLATHSRGDAAIQLLARLGLVGSQGNVNDAIDILIPGPLRANFIATLAKAGLRIHSRALYERWGAPLNYIVDSKKVQNHTNQLLSYTISQQKHSAHISNVGSSSDLSISVRQSSECLMGLVRLFTYKVDPRNFAPIQSELSQDGTLEVDLRMVPHEDVQFAYHVVFEYYNSQPLTLMDRQHYIRLSSAYYSLHQRAAAFKCLADIVKREDKPTITEASELVRLLSSINLERTIQLVQERASYWTKGQSHHSESEDKESLSRLYEPLLEKCISKHNRDLAEKLLASARDNGLEGHVSLRALEGLIKYAFKSGENRLPETVVTTGKSSVLYAETAQGRDALYIAKWIKGLMDNENWRPDPLLLSWVINKAIVRKVQNPEPSFRPRSNHPLYSTHEKDREAAILLLSLSAKHLGYIHTATVYQILKCIQNKTYHVRKERKDLIVIQGLAVDIDKVVKVIRWVQHLQEKEDKFTLDDAAARVISTTGEPSITPNILSPALYRYLIVAYLRAGDMLGAANIMQWARQEAQLTLEDLEEGWVGTRNGFRNYIKDCAYRTGKDRKVAHGPSDILAMFAGSVTVPKSKLWWERPTEF